MAKPAKQKYLLKDGSVVPGVTTVIGDNSGWNKGPLMYWAWTQGRDGFDFRETKEDAAEAGTIAHKMAECDVKGLPPPLFPMVEAGTLEKAKTAFGAYLEWKSMSRLELFESECRMISEEFRCGGTIDAVAKINEKLALIDFKTSNGTYPDHVIQVGAYTSIWEENHPGVHLLGGVHLLRFGKEGGTFTHHYFPRDLILGEPLQAFKLFRQLHSLRKPLEKMT